MFLQDLDIKKPKRQDLGGSKFEGGGDRLVHINTKGVQWKK